MLEIRAAASLDEVDPSAWDRLAAPFGFYLSHSWLRMVESDANATVEYLLAMEDGSLLGALPVYDVVTETNDFYRPSTLIDGRWRGRYLLAGARRAYANALLVAEGGGAEAGPARGMLLEALESRVRQRQAEGALFLYLDSASATRLSGAGRRPVPLLTAASAELELPGHDFSAYLASFGSLRRKAVRREMAAFDASGFSLGEERLESCWEEAAPLLAQMQARYGHASGLEQMRAMLERHVESLAGDAVVFTCRDGRRLVGFCVAYVFGDALYERMAGFDYPSLRDSFEYFNLCLYRPLAYAYRNRLKRLDLGRESYEAKVLRGARLRPLWSLALSEAQGGGEEDWNSWAATGWRATFPNQPEVFTDPGWRRWGCAPQEPPRYYQ